MRNPNPKLDEVDLWARIIPTEGCWHWIGYIDHRSSSGYGRVFWDGKLRFAHRVVYELLRSPIPDGLTIDHLCRNRSCVNPDHMEPVTNRENGLRGVGACAQHARQTHCKRGHPLSGRNLYLRTNGQRGCRACYAISKRKQMAVHPEYFKEKDRKKWIRRREAARLAALAGEERK